MVLDCDYTLTTTLDLLATTLPPIINDFFVSKDGISTSTLVERILYSPGLHRLLGETSNTSRPSQSCPNSVTDSA